MAATDWPTVVAAVGGAAAGAVMQSALLSLGRRLRRDDDRVVAWRRWVNRKLGRHDDDLTGMSAVIGWERGYFPRRQRPENFPPHDEPPDPLDVGDMSD